MIDNYEISVLVVTYNPVWESLRNTLMSILFQKECNYQIVISDDGSKENYFEYVTRLFEEFNFKSYKLLYHKDNAGTVKNLLSGLEICDSQYVKDIGQGDLLHDENALRYIVDCFSLNDCDAVFGDPIPYVNKKKYLAYGEYSAFQYYISQVGLKRNLLKKYVLLFTDCPHGACLAFKKNVLQKYLNEIQDYILLCEDLSFRLMIYDDLDIKYLPFNVVFYEKNTGTSQNGWNKTVAQDTIKYFQILKSRPDYKVLSNHLKFELELQQKTFDSFFLIRSVFRVFRLLSDFRVFKYVFYKRIKPRKLHPANAEFLKKCTGMLVKNEGIVCK